MSKVNVQGLQDKTAYPISFALLGVLPLDAVVHKNALTTFLSKIRQKGSIENDIALRQIVMKDVKDKSWFMFVREILHMTTDTSSGPGNPLLSLMSECETFGYLPLFSLNIDSGQGLQVPVQLGDPILLLYCL